MHVVFIVNVTIIITISCLGNIIVLLNSNFEIIVILLYIDYVMFIQKSYYSNILKYREILKALYSKNPFPYYFQFSFFSHVCKKIVAINSNTTF